MSEAFQNMLAGFQAGTNLRLQREAEARKQQFNALAKDAYTAVDPASRRAAVGNAVGVDAESGLELDRSMQDYETRRNMTVANAARLLVSAPDQYKPQVYARMRGDLLQYIPNMPEQYDDTVAQAAQSIVTAYGAGADNAEPTGFRQFKLFASAAGLTPGSPEYIQAANISLGREGRAASGGISFDTITGADGRERISRRNPRTGAVEVFDENANAFVPVGGGAAPTRQDMEADIALANEMSQAGVPPESIDRFLAARGQRASSTTSPSLAVGRAKEEEAAAVTAAQEAAKLQYAPQFAEVDAQAAAQKKLAEADAERQVSRQKRAIDSAEMLPLLDQAEALLPKATGSGIGNIRDKGARFFGASTEGANNASELDILASRFVQNVPRFEGPQSNIDVQMYMAAAGDLANRKKTTEERLAALRRMRVIAKKYAGTTAAGGGRQVKRTGTHNGRKVIQYTDGSIEYAD